MWRFLVASHLMPSTRYIDCAPQELRPIRCAPVIERQPVSVSIPEERLTAEKTVEAVLSVGIDELTYPPPVIVWYRNGEEVTRGAATSVLLSLSDDDAPVTEVYAVVSNAEGIVRTDVATVTIVAAGMGLAVRVGVRLL